MNRREFNSVWLPVLALGAGLTGLPAQAVAWGELSQSEALQGMRAALKKGADSAVRQLGRENGFWGNETVRIRLPEHLNDAAGWMRRLGQGERVDELLMAMNRAAEEAVPMAADMLQSAVRNMTASDGKKILTGGETSVTEFFAAKTRQPLSKKFQPVIAATTRKVELADKYNNIAGRAAGIGLVRPEDANVEAYVGRKALDGLYYMIGEEEKKIRRDPLKAGSTLLARVFGSIR